MGSGIAKKAAIQSKTALDRIASLEERVEQITEGLQRVLQNVEARFSGLDDIAQSTAEVVGHDKVQAELIRRQQVRTEEKVAAQKTLLKSALEANKVAAADVVDEECWVVGQVGESETDERAAGYVQEHFSNLTEESKLQLLGKTVGSVLDIEDKKFYLKGVYKEVQDAAATTTPSA